MAVIVGLRRLDHPPRRSGRMVGALPCVRAGRDSELDCVRVRFVCELNRSFLHSWLQCVAQLLLDGVGELAPFAILAKPLPVRSGAELIDRLRTDGDVQLRGMKRLGDQGRRSWAHVLRLREGCCGEAIRRGPVDSEGVHLAAALGCELAIHVDQKLLERLELCLVVWLTVVLHRILQSRMDIAASAGGRFGAHGCATGVGHTARAPRRGWVAGRRLAAAQLKGSICSQLHARPAAWSTSPPLSLWPKPSAQALPSPPARPDR